MDRTLALLAAAFGLLACDRRQAPPELPKVAPFANVSSALPATAVPGEPPASTARALPTAEVPEDPYLAHGQTVYREGCMFCHDRGAANTPPIANLAEWQRRLGKGKETLYNNALKGFKGYWGFMPAKGGNPNRSDKDVRAAVDYMIYLVERQR